MAKELLPDALWARIAPLLPPEPPKPKGGRPRVPRVSDRAALTGILFVLKTGIPWEYLPKQKFIRSRGVGAGCGMTCWHRLRDWYRAGVWRSGGCTRCFSKSWPRPIASTGTGPRWTPPRCRLRGGPRNGQEPNGSRRRHDRCLLTLSAYGEFFKVLQ